MIETAITFIETLPLLGIIAFAFFITFLENVFPPSPSDLLLVFLGTLVGLDRIGFAPLLVVATAGSTVGFMLMYYLGKNFSHKVIESKKFSFISLDLVHNVESLFRRHGKWIIVGNRFLSGTRAVISFVAGMSEYPFGITTTLCVIGSLLWNAMLIGSGWALGSNWRIVEEYLQLYGQFFLIITIMGAIGFGIWYFATKKLPSKNDTPPGE